MQYLLEFTKFLDSFSLFQVELKWWKFVENFYFCYYFISISISVGIKYFSELACITYCLRLHNLFVNIVNTLEPKYARNQ